MRFTNSKTEGQWWWWQDGEEEHKTPLTVPTTALCLIPGSPTRDYYHEKEADRKCCTPSYSCQLMVTIPQSSLSKMHRVAWDLMTTWLSGTPHDLPLSPMHQTQAIAVQLLKCDVTSPLSKWLSEWLSSRATNTGEEAIGKVDLYSWCGKWACGKWAS